MLGRHNLDDLVETTISCLRAVRNRPLRKNVPFSLEAPAAPTIPDFLAPASLPADMARRHDLFVTYVNVLAPLSEHPEAETPVTHAVMVSMLHLVVMVFNDGIEIECMPRGDLRHAEPDFILYVLRFLRGLPLHDILVSGDQEADQLAVNLMTMHQELESVLDPMDATVVTAGLKILTLLDRDGRDRIIGLAIDYFSPIGRPYYRREPVGGQKGRVFLHALVAQDTSLKRQAKAS